MSYNNSFNRFEYMYVDKVIDGVFHVELGLFFVSDDYA